MRGPLNDVVVRGDVTIAVDQEPAAPTGARGFRCGNADDATFERRDFRTGGCHGSQPDGEDGDQGPGVHEIPRKN